MNIVRYGSERYERVDNTGVETVEITEQYESLSDMATDIMEILKRAKNSISCDMVIEIDVDFMEITITKDSI